jgi:hypothetical protein
VEAPNNSTLLRKQVAMKLVIIIFMAIAWFSNIFAEESAEEFLLKKESEIRAAFSRLDERQPKEIVDKNLQIVLEGGEVSLRILIEEMGNRAIAHSSFEGTSNVSIPTEKNGIVPNKMSLGEVAVDLIKYLLEGKIPLVYRKYFFLTESNVKQWLDERKGKSLKQLQIEAVTENLKNAEELNTHLSNEFSRGLVDFLKKRSELLQGPNLPPPTQGSPSHLPSK